MNTTAQTSLWQQLYQLQLNNGNTDNKTPVSAYLPFKHRLQMQHNHQDFTVTNDGTNRNIETQAIGLYQTLTALPDHYLDLMLQNQHLNEHTLADFIQMFNQHWIALCYSAWLKSRLSLSHGLTPKDNPYRNRLSAISGQTPSSTATISQDARLYYAGLLQSRHISATQLRQLLQDFFQIPVCIKQNRGQWLSISRQEQLQIGEHNSNNQLGVNSFVGDRSWDCQYKITIQLGPMSLKQYNAMLPGKAAHQQLLEWIRHTCPAHFTFNIQLILEQKSIPNLQLNQQQLGYNTWIGKHQFKQHANHLILGDYYVNA